MKNRDLEVEILNVTGQLNQAISRSTSIFATLNKGGLTEADRTQLASEQAEVQQQIVNLTRQRQVLFLKRDALVRTSPIAGIVTTWEIEKKLVARPVVTGQLLVNIADLSKEWEIEVLMPEKRMKHLDAAFANTKEKYLPASLF